MPKNILFLCVANSARSQMAEGLARSLFPDDTIRSAGSMPTEINPYAVRAMAEIGIDISAQSSTAVADVDGDVDLVITLCQDEVCPALLQPAAKMHWPLPDPDRKNEALSDEERLAEFRKIRDQIHGRLKVLRATMAVPEGPASAEFHASIRVPDLAEGARFYSWLLGVGVASAADVIDAHERAKAAGFHIEKPARTTWRGTPLHELWLKDPGGNLIEIYARLTPAELRQMPPDKEPVFLGAI